VARPQRVDAKHIRNEPELLVGLVEQRLDALRSVSLRRNPKPRSLAAHLGHTAESIAEAGFARLGRRGYPEPDI